MILKRIAQGIKEQDWFVVSVEIMVVVIGIFIGLQVDDWNEDRKEAALERDYILRLLDDANESIAEMEVALENHDMITNEIQWMVTIVDQRGLNEETMVRFNNNYWRLTGWAQLNFYEDTIEELVSAGRLTIISSQELRSKIARFRIDYEKYYDRAAVIGTARVDAAMELTKIVRLGPGSRDIVTDIETLQSSDLFYNQINAILGAQKGLHNFSKEIYAQTLTFKTDLEKALEELD